MKYRRIVLSKERAGAQPLMGKGAWCVAAVPEREREPGKDAGRGQGPDCMGPSG